MFFLVLYILLLINSLNICLHMYCMKWFSNRLWAQDVKGMVVCVILLLSLGFSDGGNHEDRETER